MASISVAGGFGGSPLVTITTFGPSSYNTTQDFANGVAQFLNAGLLVENTSAPDGQLNVVNSAAGGTVLNAISGAGSYTLDQNGQFTYLQATGPTTLTGSTGDTNNGGYSGDAVVASGGVEYDAEGDDNSVTFTSGNNVYQGGDTSKNTIAAGAGTDTIVAGTGADNTVFGGAGSKSVIFLQDTASASGNGDIVELAATTAQGGGGNVVNAFGTDDTVSAASSGNSIFGGTGKLTFTAQATSAVTTNYITAGSGVTNMFGAPNLNLVLSNDPSDTYSNYTFVAGAGNETLNGANAAGGFVFFGDPSRTDSVNYSVVGASAAGANQEYFSTGAGTESFILGTANTVLDINTVTGGANIMVYDFNAALDYLMTDSTTVSDSQATTVNGSASSFVTLSDGTTVTFVGVTTAPTIHH